MKPKKCFALFVLCVCAVSGLAQQKAAGDAPYRELQSYRKDRGRGDLWRNIVVSPKIKRDALVALARQLHKDDPQGRIRIFTDDKQFVEFMERDINYPDPAYTYPEKWANKHYIGMINRMFGRGGGRWVLTSTSSAGTKLIGEDVPLD